MRTKLGLFLIPLAILGLNVLGYPPPFYRALRYAEPDFGYLLNSLLLLLGHGAEHVDHPGSPLQLLGSLVVGARYFSSGEFRTSGLVDSVLLHPLTYLREINFILAILLGGTCLLFGELLVRLKYPILVAVAAQLSVFFFSETWTYLFRLSPEILILSLCFCFAACLHVWEKTADKRIPVLHGIVLGLLVATKFNCLPLVISIGVFRRRKEILSSGAALIVTFLISTIPAWGNYPRMLRWLWNIFSHQGIYGSGAPGIFPDLSSLAQNFLHLAEVAPFFFFVMAILAAYSYFSKSGTLERKSSLIALSMVALFFLMVMKHPGGRYLLPVAGVVFWLMPRLLLWGWNSFDKPFAFSTIALGLLLLIPATLSWRNQRGDLTRVIAAETNFEIAKSKMRKCAFIISSPAPSVAFALSMGELVTGGFFTSTLQRFYPGTILYDSHPGFFHSFAERLDSKQVQERLKHSSCIVLEGSGRFLNNQAGSFKRGVEAIELGKVDAPFSAEPIFEEYQIGLYKLASFK